MEQPQKEEKTILECLTHSEHDVASVATNTGRYRMCFVKQYVKDDLYNFEAA